MNVSFVLVYGSTDSREGWNFLGKCTCLVHTREEIPPICGNKLKGSQKFK